VNTVMSLAHLSILHINFQSKLKIRTNHNLPVFSVRELFSTLSVLFVFNFNILYIIHTRLSLLHAGLFYTEIYFTILTLFSPIG